MDKGDDQFAFHHYSLQVVLIWAAMADFLVFLALISSPPSSTTAGAAAADHFVTEFAMDHWVVWRTSLLPFFWVLVDATTDHFPLYIFYT